MNWGKVLAGSIYAELLKYSKALQPWQRDALRRLTEVETLSSADIDELTNIAFVYQLKKAKGLIDDKTVMDPPNAVPLDKIHLPSTSTQSPPVSLVSVKHIQGVNRLRAGAELTLKPKGLNIVFGTNGVGKSGYTRILKRSCHSRYPEVVRGNVFEAESLEPIARVSYLLGEEEQHHEWHLSEASSDPHLPRVAVYDSKTAMNHVSSKGATLTVTPEGLELLTNLVRVYNAVTAEAKHRIAVVQATVSPSVISEAVDPSVAAALGKLGNDGGYLAVQTLAVLDEKELADLKALPMLISQQKSTSQAVRLAEAQGRASQATSQIQRIETLSEKVSAGQVQALREIWNRLNVIGTEQSVLQKHDFTSEAVDGVMSPYWRTMWDAAKKYADEVAYPEHQFPSPDMSHCVLCHQPMNNEIHERLRRFSEAMKVDLSAEKRLKSDQAQQILDGIRTATSDENFDENLLAILAEEDPAAVQQLKADIKTAKTLLGPSAGLGYGSRSSIQDLTAPFIEGAVVEDGSGSPVLGFPISGSLDGAVIRLNKVAEARKAEVKRIQDETPDGSQLAEQEKRLLNLEERHRLASVLPELKNLNNRLLHVQALQSVISEAFTTQLSLKSGSLSQTYVNKVAHDFRQNLRILEGTEGSGTTEPRIKVDLIASKVTKGVSQTAFTIQGAVDAKTFAEGVLSEGELRMVSLSGFLADVATSGDGSAIIFDDPMNSLDQDYQIRVARRLVKEARGRQVVIFTHSLPFVGALLHEGIKKDWQAQIDEGIESPVQVTHSYIQIVQRTETGTGQQVGTAGNIKGSFGPLMELLEQQLYQSAKRLYDDANEEAYALACDTFATNLRMAWEYAVEEIVVNGIVARNKPGVSTSHLNTLLTLDITDVVAVNRGMDLSSFYVHATAEGNEQPLPTPEQLYQRLTDLRLWAKDYRRRRDS